jgi:striatin 1/3/4
MQFHPVDPLLCTASEDGTMKLWNLAKAQPEDAKSTINDLDPVYTFRGHRCVCLLFLCDIVFYSSAVLSLVLSPTGDMAYTGGADGTVRCWMLPSPNTDPFDRYGLCFVISLLFILFHFRCTHINGNIDGSS